EGSPYVPVHYDASV
nr:Chain B, RIBONUCLEASE A [synthetic construct]